MHAMKRFGVCFKLETAKNTVKAKLGVGRFGCPANLTCRDANGKVQTSCSVAVQCQICLFCMRSHVSVFVCNNYLFVFGLAGRLFASIRIANWDGKTLFVSTRLAGL